MKRASKSAPEAELGGKLRGSCLSCRVRLTRMLHWSNNREISHRRAQGAARDQVTLTNMQDAKAQNNAERWF